MKGRSALKVTSLKRTIEITHAAGGISRRSALGVVAVALMIPIASAAAQTPVIRVHKDPNCGCCTGWVRHIQAAGFSVTVREDANLQNVRKRAGVPADLSACHTAEADGYVIEGHVPASAIQRLLKERPVATGIAPLAHRLSLI